MLYVFYTLFLIFVQTCWASVIDAGPKFVSLGTARAISAVPTGSSFFSKREALTCPEALGGTPWTCSYGFCGGEDQTNRGFCTKLDAAGNKCKCTSSGPTAVLQFTTVASTQSNGQTVVATYALQTISAYASLRQAITTTITETTTAMDGTIGVETAAAVIMAGGVAWFLAGFIGDAAAAEALDPPTSNPDHQDDPTCPEPVQQCSECGGVNEICVTGPTPGCACENVTPEPCPSGEDSLECSECGGAGSAYNICAGLANQNDLYKDCFCIGLDDYAAVVPPDYPSDSSIQAVFANLLDWTDDSYSRPPNVAPVCQHADWTAPQRDNDGSPSVQTSIDQWCSFMDGRTVTQQPHGVDVAFQMYRFSYYSYWLSASNWYYAPSGNQCGVTTPVTKAECVDSLTFAMEQCDPSSGITHGASYVGQCISYNITLDSGLDPQSPPWNRLPAAAYGRCAMNDASDVQYSFWRGVYPQFCSQVDQNPTAALSKDLTQKDFVAVNSRSLSWRTPPPSTGEYPPKYGNNWIFHFEFTGANGNCRKSCSDALYTLSLSPCAYLGNQGNSMASAGSVDVGCGTYGYTISPPDPDETICQIAAQWYETVQETTFTLTNAMDAINKFCSDEKALVSNPMQSDTFLQNMFTDTGPYPFRYYLYGDAIIEIYAAFADTVGLAAADCKPDKDFYVKDYKSNCMSVLSKSVNRCNTGTVTNKKGSFTVEHNADHGCVVWQIFAYVNKHE